MSTTILMNEKFKDDEEYRRYFPVAVDIHDGMVWVRLADGRVIGNPLEWHPWLVNATPEQRANVVLRVHSVDWPDIDEGLDIEGMLRGIHSSLTPKQTEQSPVKQTE